jgi:hypothetical protein
MAIRDELKTLIDELPDSRLEVVLVMLEHQLHQTAPIPEIGSPADQEPEPGPLIQQLS